MKVGVRKETAVNERRVALVPDTVARLVKSGLAVVVEQGAGTGAAWPDASYRAAGAELAPTATAVFATADVVTKVRPPSADEAGALKGPPRLVRLPPPLPAPPPLRHPAPPPTTTPRPPPPPPPHPPA